MDSLLDVSQVISFHYIDLLQLITLKIIIPRTLKSHEKNKMIMSQFIYQRLENAEINITSWEAASYCRNYSLSQERGWLWTLGHESCKAISGQLQYYLSSTFSTLLISLFSSYLAFFIWLWHHKLNMPTFLFPVALLTNSMFSQLIEN